MKQITIAGNIGRDAVVRRTNAGDAVAGVPVAVEERNGQDRRTLWFDCSLWGKRGEALAQYLTKGSRVTVKTTVKVHKIKQAGADISKNPQKASGRNPQKASARTK